MKELAYTSSLRNDKEVTNPKTQLDICPTSFIPSADATCVTLDEGRSGILRLGRGQRRGDS